MTGFRSIQNLTGGMANLQTFKVVTSADLAYFIGDPVVLTNAGTVRPFTASTTAGSGQIGVVQSVYASASDGLGGQIRPLTFNQPTRGNYLATAQAGYVKLSVDPDQVYLGTIDVSVSAGLIGQTVRVSAGTPNTRIGRSGFTLAGTTIAETVGPFKIVGIADKLSGRGDQAASNFNIKVKLNSTAFSSTTAV